MSQPALKIAPQPINDWTPIAPKATSEDAANDNSDRTRVLENRRKRKARIAARRYN